MVFHKYYLWNKNSHWVFGSKNWSTNESKNQKSIEFIILLLISSVYRFENLIFSLKEINEFYWRSFLLLLTWKINNFKNIPDFPLHFKPETIFVYFFTNPKVQYIISNYLKAIIYTIIYFMIFKKFLIVLILILWLNDRRVKVCFSLYFSLFLGLMFLVLKSLKKTYRAFLLIDGLSWVSL
jgi:hypothetical protein